MIDESLRQAYLATDYILAVGAVSIRLNIGRDAPELDRLLTARSVDTAAFVTAWNPRSAWLPVAENLLLAARLAAAVEECGFQSLPVTTTADDPRWIEQGLFILGISEEAARRLGRDFDQNAIVMVNRGSPPRLIDLVSPAGAS